MTLSGIKNQVEEVKSTTIKNHLLVLPYKGEKGILIFNSMKRNANKILVESFKVQTVYTGKLLSSCFKTKDKTKFEHQDDIIYQEKCFAENCLDD